MGVQQLAKVTETDTDGVCPPFLNMKVDLRGVLSLAPAGRLGGHVVLRRAQLANRHKLPVFLIQCADLVLQYREQPRLDAVP